MKYLIIMWAVSFLFAMGLILIEEKVIPGLSDENKFKKWWRRNIVGIYNKSDF